MVGIVQVATSVVIISGCLVVVVFLASVASHLGRPNKHGQYHHNQRHTSSSNARDKRPNFIIIFADDIGWGDLGANWNIERSNTPNLDSLANNGIRFTDFHSAESVCTPSRASLLTGRLGLRTGVVQNFEVDAIGGLPLNETTFAETFKASGYRTGIVGKWHLGANGNHHPSHRGFDYFFGLPHSNAGGCVDRPGLDIPLCEPCQDDQSPNYMINTNVTRVDCYDGFPLPLFENTTIVEQPTDLFTLAAKFTNSAHDFILKSKDNDQPFLLYMALTHMHVPITHNERFNNASGGDGVYADSLREMDFVVGEIVNAVRQADKEDNTLIWFTGDNGPWEIKCQLGGDPGPFLGSWQKEQGGGGSSSKTTIWEAGHREPSLAYWPGRIAAGQVTDSILSAMDIFPTMANIAGVVMPPNRRYDGIDISDVLFHSKQIHDRVLFHPSYIADGRLHGVRMGKYKALFRIGGTYECGGRRGPIIRHDPPLIFNLVTDPAESKNLDKSTEEYKVVSARIQNALLAIMEDIRTDNTTVANYDTDPSAAPCCNPDNRVCRCEN